MPSGLRPIAATTFLLVAWALLGGCSDAETAGTATRGGEVQRGSEEGDRPDRALLTAGGRTVRAVVGSFCVSRTSGERVEGYCRDAFSEVRGRPVVAAARSAILVRLGAPALQVIARLGRRTGGARRTYRRASAELPVAPADGSRRAWRVTLPASVPGGDLGLLLEATYEDYEGDPVPFAARLRICPTASPCR